MIYKNISKLFIILAFFAYIIITSISSANASRADDLKNLIKEREKNIQQLEQEINLYEDRLLKTEKEANTLANTIKSINTSINKLNKEIELTQIKIESTNYNIENIEIDIKKTGGEINENKKAIISIMQKLREKDQDSLIEVFLYNKSLSSFLSSIENLESLQKNMTISLDKLKKNKEQLKIRQDEAKKQRENLSILQKQLLDQKKVANITKNEKDKLLKITKNKQSEYERILEEKRQAKKEFEQDIAQYEKELTEVLNKSAIPIAKEGALQWPIKGKIIITQYFGNTPFATKNPAIYHGKGHNGIDIGVPMGTPIYSAREGTVVASGNTDNVCPNSSYGKWVLVKHDNGLTTLYAHLSLISTQSGKAVDTNTIIGYSGSSGYSTGPHLHFTLYASDAVRVGTLTSRACKGAKYTIPLLSKIGGYLNPLSYLPAEK